ncbi:protein kinase [Corallococcus sp. H22C18031201]|uniref:bifunctional serine/threonine-protein kinase/formylglycine-generating enzyme family protein n=1 Tax=Citreicoccus inhibens TaxID=2849499 RepID=UPI000E70895D|nr:bifunctional serine/threonine-protein kinase/formylglycine-generating enzyme family protein [Citreicoccus inhibens]MBU8897687.1 SUMF1/EgtB/PvdO family nonheme iron enzyme [Citreicoccus inhibens]RJS27459.1 protein kinase [Corallococcus sp. H22C18031201]
MLCYRCGSHVPETSDTCPTCGLKSDAAARQAAGVARKRGGDSAPYKPGDVVAGRYAIQELVGSGPLGFVFRAQDQQIDVEVALKAIQSRLVQQPEERTQFSLSLRVGKKLNHPNLARVYEEGLDGDRPFFTMQLLEGTSLRRMMEQRAQRGLLFSMKEVEPLLAQMAAALDGAHRFGPHSDLKPENVLVLPDMVKVTDYGLGLAVPHLPFAQAQKGHRADIYIAPEYMNGGELDTRMDVYSLGVIVGEMITGLVPDGSIPELLVKHPDLPPHFEALYRRALNGNPLARPKTAGEFHAEFVNVMQRSPAAATRARAVPSAESLAQAAAARAASRLPPPVPTGLLPSMESSEPFPVAAPRVPAPPPAMEEDEPPPDATQPLDAATLAMILNAQSKSKGLGGDGAPAATLQDLHLVARAAAEPAPDARAAQRADFDTRASPRAAPVADGRPAPRGESAPDGRSSPSPEARPPARPEPAPAPRAEPPPDGRQAARAAPEPARPPQPRPGDVATLQDMRSVPRGPARTLDTMQSALRASSRAAGEASTSGMRTAPRNMDLSPSMSGARAAPKLPPGSTGALRMAQVARAARARSRAIMWLVILGGAGVGLGAGGGWLVLHRRAQQVEAASVGPGAAVPARPAPSATGEPAGGVPVAVVPSERCPVGMKWVSGGTFKMGTPPDDKLAFVDERPLQNVQVASFCVDEYEYPNRAGEPPRVQVSWEEAKSLCESEGKRLCTEEEWEKACKGPGNARFPYRTDNGSTFNPDACNTEDRAKKDRALAPSGQFKQCRSGYGVADMSGNVAEWTATRHGANAGFTQKGGSFDGPDYAVRCSARKNGVPEEKSDMIGLRCCAGVGP